MRKRRNQRRFWDYLVAALLVACPLGPAHAVADVDAPRDDRLDVNAGLVVLGELGVDASLWDHVENRRPLTVEDREPFYRLLDAVGKIEIQELVRRAQRSLGQANSSIVPLFNEPDKQFGQLVVLVGTARRAVKIYVGSAYDSEGAREVPQSGQDVVARDGMDHYYELDMITSDSQNHPIVFCVRRLPPDFPEGENINEPVRAAGFFFKVWAYSARGDEARRTDTPGQTKRQWELAPLVIGPGVQWLRTPESEGGSYAGLVAGALFALALAGIWLVVWNYRRGDRQFDQRAMALRDQGHAAGSFDQIELEADGEPPG